LIPNHKLHFEIGELYYSPKYAMLIRILKISGTGHYVYNALCNFASKEFYKAEPLALSRDTDDDWVASLRPVEEVKLSMMKAIFENEYPTP
jgi:hypothetical protein